MEKKFECLIHAIIRQILYIRLIEMLQTMIKHETSGIVLSMKDKFIGTVIAVKLLDAQTEYAESMF
jgi:hypothetical protein